VGIGAIAAVRARSTLDHVLMGLPVLAVSTPVFWLGLVLAVVFSVTRGWLPVSGYGDGALRNLVLPAVTLGALHTGTVARMTRSSLLEVVRQDFMATARAKGLSEWAVLGKHALRNAAVPVVTVVGIGLADLLVGAPLTETVFAWPGVGRLLVAAVGVETLVVVLGCAIGLLAGYFGGPVDAALMRVTDVVMAFPSLVLAIGLIAVFERPGLDKVFIVLVALGWTTIARVVRGEVLSLKARDFVQAARALGGGHRAIMLRHLLPNAVAPLLVAATIGVGGNMVAEAGLSFLGLGAQSPTISWGAMLADGQPQLGVGRLGGTAPASRAQGELAGLAPGLHGGREVLTRQGLVHGGQRGEPGRVTRVCRAATGDGDARHGALRAAEGFARLGDRDAAVLALRI